MKMVKQPDAPQLDVGETVTILGASGQRVVITRLAGEKSKKTGKPYDFLKVEGYDRTGAQATVSTTVADPAKG